MNKIVFLDSSTVNYNDIDFKNFSSLGNFSAYKTTSPDEIEKRIIDADIVISNKVIFTDKVLRQCKNLKLIAVAATGYNILNLSTAKDLNIAVANVAGYSTESVAQQTLAYIFALATNLIKYNEACHSGKWSQSPIFTMGNWPIIDLQDKSIGIIGFGTIGQRVAELCNNIGMQILTLNRSKKRLDYVKYLEMPELINSADVISIHAPLTNETDKLVNLDFLKKMKKTAFLLNLGRGQIVDSKALKQALEEKIIAGAALDVLETEPPNASNELLKLQNLILTPHTAWASKKSRLKLVNEIYKNIEAFLRGEERNIVN